MKRAYFRIVRRYRRSYRLKGFLLIEALCSLALLSMVILLMARVSTSLFFLYQDGLRRLHALTYAQLYIESWIAEQKVSASALSYSHSMPDSAHA